MKLLIGMPSPDSWGGPAACEPPFVEALRQLGVVVETATYVYGEKERSTSILSRIARVIRTAITFRRMAATTAPDLIHLNTAFEKKTILRDAFTIFLMGRKRPKIFLKVHGAGAHFIKHGSIVWGALIRYLDKRVDGYGIYTIEELETFLPHGIDRAKFHLIKNVVQLSVAVSADGGRFGSPDPLELLFVSRFVKTKGLLETIEAVKIAREKGARVSLTCIGDGPIKAVAEKLARTLGAGEYVKFTGYIPEDDVDGYLSRADIFIFPTRHNEGFPIALFKAVIAGLPIITSRVRAAAEYLDDRVNCLFCTPDPAGIAEKIIELIGDPELRKRMSDANRKFEHSLAPESIAREYLTVYEKIIAK